MTTHAEAFAAIASTEEYQLSVRATALKKAGDMEGAVAALQQRKRVLGSKHDDTRLAKFLQAAGRFDEALSEIDELIEAVPRQMRKWSLRTVLGQQRSKAEALGRIHEIAALICKREKRADLAAQHRTKADAYLAIGKRMGPLADAAEKAARLAENRSFLARERHAK